MERGEAHAGSKLEWSGLGSLSSGETAAAGMVSMVGIENGTERQGY